MDKKLEARIRRLERIMKNEDAKAEIDVKGTLENMQKEYRDIAEAVERLSENLGETGKAFSTAFYQMGVKLSFCVSFAKRKLG